MQLAALQPTEVHLVAGTINVAIIAVMVLLMRWPDRLLPMRYITGFHITGTVEHAGIFPAADIPATFSPEDLKARNEHNLEEWGKYPEDANAAFLVECCEQDAEKNKLSSNIWIFPLVQTEKPTGGSRYTQRNRDASDVE